MVYLSVSTLDLFHNKLVWEEVCLLPLELASQWGLGLLGDWGPFKLIPQQQSKIQFCIHCTETVR